MPTKPSSPLQVRRRRIGPQPASFQIVKRRSASTVTTKLALIALSAIVLILLPGCGSTPVAASCPPFPPIPQAVEDARKTVGLSASAETDYLKDFEQAFNALVDDLRNSLNAALVASPALKPVPPGR